MSVAEEAAETVASRAKAGSKIGGGVRLNVLAWAQRALSAILTINDEVTAKGARDEITSSYLARGYTQKQIDELMELRFQLDYRATEMITFPMMYLNQDYDPAWEEYRNKIPEGVIVPDKDVPWLKKALKVKGREA